MATREGAGLISKYTTACTQVGSVIEFINGRLPIYFIDIKTLSLTLIGLRPYKCMMTQIISSMVDITNSFLIDIKTFCLTLIGEGP